MEMKLLVVLSLAFLGSALAKEEAIWSGAGRLEQFDQIYAQDRTCRLALYGDGNVVVQRKIRTLDDADNEWVTSWTSGSQKRSALYGLELASNGNLAVYDEDESGFGLQSLWKTLAPPMNLWLMVNAVSRFSETVRMCGKT